MKAKHLFYGTTILFLTACTADRIVLEEMTVIEPEKYKYFQNDPIKITTTDTIQAELINPKGNITLTVNRLLSDHSINTYKFLDDSLFINDPYFHTVIGLRTISSVKFNGAWDSELHFVHEDLLNDYLPADYGKTIGGITGSILGCAVGVLASVGIGKIFDSYDLYELLIIPVAIGGGIGGAILGSNIGSSKPPNVEEVLNKIKRERGISNSY